MKCISHLAQSCSQSATLSLFNDGLQVYLATNSICASKFTPSWPPCASPHSLDCGLQLYCWVYWSIIFRHISNISPTTPSVNPDILCVDGYLIDTSIYRSEFKLNGRALKNFQQYIVAVSSRGTSSVHNEEVFSQSAVYQLDMLWWLLTAFWGLSSGLPDAWSLVIHVLRLVASPAQ